MVEQWTASTIRTAWQSIKCKIEEKHVISAELQAEVRNLLKAVAKASKPVQSKTPLLLTQLRELWKQKPRTNEHTRLTINIITIMFFGMLRVSEVIPQPNTQNRGMTLSDLILVKDGAPTNSQPDGLHLVIRSSKTDQTNQGEIHWFARCINKEDPCPVQAAHEIKLMAQENRT